MRKAIVVRFNLIFFSVLANDFVTTTPCVQNFRSSHIEVVKTIISSKKFVFIPYFYQNFRKILFPLYCMPSKMKIDILYIQ
jgi:hypothetical protein